MEEVAAGRIAFGADETTVPRIVRFLFESEGQVMQSVFYSYAQIAAMEFEELMGAKLFENPKNWRDLARLIRYLTTGDDIVFDFFAGSASTAHAVMALNSENDEKRRFVLVQIGESCKDHLVANQHGFANVADIGKARIRKAGIALREKGGLLAKSLDTGFRVLKVDTSNMKDVYYKPDSLKREDLFAHIENIKEDRTPDDLLFQVLLDWGVDLSLPIAQETIEGKVVFFVDQTALAACFDTGVSEDLVKLIAARKPMRVVFRDAGFSSDAVKINVEQIFKLLSPDTEVRAL